MRSTLISMMVSLTERSLCEIKFDFNDWYNDLNRDFSATQFFGILNVTKKVVHKESPATE